MQSEVTREVNVVRSMQQVLQRATMIDLSHRLEEGIPTYPTHTKYFQNRWLALGDVASLNQLILGEHTGTHVDSPCHFPVDGPHANVSIDELNVDALTGRAATIHIDTATGANNEMVDPGQILAWEEMNGPLLEGDIVLLDFGWGADRWALYENGFGYLQGWPGLSKASATLLTERRVRAVGTDCVSIDSGDDGRGDLPSHFVLLAAGVLILENLANLHELPPWAFFLAFPLRIVGGTGSPLRAVALVDA